MPGDQQIRSSVLYAGTSGWAYPAWKPAFYPAKLPQKDFLKFYSTQLNAVEVNFTFRRFLTEKIIAGWVAQTPGDFRFAVKAHQAITHHRRLKNAEESLQRFRRFHPATGPGQPPGPGAVPVAAQFRKPIRTCSILSSSCYRANCRRLSSFAIAPGSMRRYSPSCGGIRQRCASRKTTKPKRPRCRPRASAIFVSAARSTRNRSGTGLRPRLPSW